MKYAMIGTWAMSLEGVQSAYPLLAGGAAANAALEKAVCAVEDNPRFSSVGHGGLPNAQGDVELDAAYMDGNTLCFGGVIGVRNVKNPIKAAIKLAGERRNCLLCGVGAEAYAQRNGFEFMNHLTESSKAKWENAIVEEKYKKEDQFYAGHDTVGMISLDASARICVGLSTSGLFMKHPGRIGDSPIIGSGFYCDSKSGGAAATGVGEDIMKGCLSYEIVRRMRDGLDPQNACELALFNHIEDLTARGHHAGMMAVVALDSAGRFGACGNLDAFAFVYANETTPPALYSAVRHNGGFRIELGAPADSD
jgi:N4-(beta-N-acetylglucosaminyl)-L-asparaginase